LKDIIISYTEIIDRERMDYKKNIIPHRLSLLWGLAFLLLVLILLFVRHILLDWHVLQGDSMSPTLQAGQKVLILKWAYGLKMDEEEPYSLLWHEPAIQDVVVFSHKGESYIKRILGVPGDTLSLSDRWLKVGDNAFFLPTDSRFLLGHPEVIPQDHYFLVGDNSRFSEDSRRIGLVSIEKIQGKMLFYSQ
jgi:signal peptidase I